MYSRNIFFASNMPAASRQNGFVTESISIVVLCCILIVGQCNIIRNVNICGHHNGRRLYLELGEQGILYASNISGVNHLMMEEQQMEKRKYEANNTWHQCNLKLVTCPSCAIAVTFKNSNLPHTCGGGDGSDDVGIVLGNPCRCNHVWISEPPYDDISGRAFCGVYTPMIYKSFTRTISITFSYIQSLKNSFTLEYVSERNRVYLDGSHDAKGNNNNSGTIEGILSSPFFPARYPRDLGLEYVISCPSEFPSCRVRVLFSDFQLATVSIIEFYDWNGQRLDVSSGARFRPPIIVSSGPSLLIRFYANGGTGLGYRAFYSYVIGHLHDDDDADNVQPITDCGGYVENLGGAITMMDMVVNQGRKTYDCVWLIRPPKKLLHMKTHIYVKVITFADMVGNAELIIKQGPTSALLPLEILRHPPSKQQLHSSPRLREHVAPISSGFHVSLRGTFGVTSRVAIAYAAFGYMDCFSSSDLLCHNHRCIASQLSCDGFDHCGDNSDEPSATCFRTWEEMPRDRKWHLNKPNYYFPKIDRYPDLKTATLVFVASSLGLIVLISALIILLYRMGARARQQRELQSRLQTISELLDGARIDEISISGAGGSGTDDPPMYEAPPGYDEVVKIGFESDVVSNRKRRRTMRSQSSPPSQRSTNVIDRIHESPQIIVSDNVQRIPESPPPPYITPPGTISRRNSIPSRHSILHISVPSSFRGNRSQRQQRRRQLWPRQNSFPGVDELTNLQLTATIESTLKSDIMHHYHHHHHHHLCKENQTSGGEEEKIINLHQQQQQQHQYSTCRCEGACDCANQSTSTFQRPVESLSRKTTILRLLGTTTTTTTTKNMAHNSNPALPTVAASVSTGHQVLLSQNNMQIETTLKNYNRESLDRSSLAVSSPHSSSSSGGGACRSEDRLVNKFGIISNTFRRKRAANQQQMVNYSTCDLESLYENIKRLDNFLAKRNNTDNNIIVGNNQSGTLISTNPEYHHGHIRSERSNQTSLFNCVRGWSSSDDTFVNNENN